MKTNKTDFQFVAPLGQPKGVLHTTAGYMIYGATTFKYVFDYQPGDVYWCTADIGWITGHTYVVYGTFLKHFCIYFIAYLHVNNFQFQDHWLMVQPVFWWVIINVNLINWQYLFWYIHVFNQFEGTPFYPDNSRFWAIVEKYKVNQFYTAPTAIR